MMEKNHEFKVKIREDSEYYQVYVDWGNGLENCYRDFDLELVSEEPREEFPVNVQPNDDIRSIRERIYQIREQIASLETEQKNLIEILDKEGFILKDFSAESPIPERVDVNDWRTWKAGDMVEMLRPWNGLEEGIHSILKIEPASYVGKMPVRVGGSDETAWPELKYLRWHSRPDG